MALTQQEKTNVLALARYFQADQVEQLVEREKYGACNEERERLIVTSNAIIRALSLENVNEMLTEEQQEAMFQRLMSLLNIKVA